MGTFLVNFHFRTEDRDGALRAARDLVSDGCWVTAPKDGWITVYEGRASDQDDARIRSLGGDLSHRLNAKAVAFLVHDSDFLCYWLFERGKIVDEFNSCPDYFSDDGPGDDEAAAGGDPQALLRLCKPGTRLRDVQRILKAESVFAEEQLQQLVALMGIDEERALADYRDMDDGSAEDFEAEFVGKSRPAASRGGRGPTTLKFPGGGSLQDEDEESDNDDEGPPEQPGGTFASKIAQMMGLTGAQQPADPLVTELVQAAADGNVPEVERLVSAGANLAGEAPMKLSPKGQSSLSARLLSGGGMAFPVTPLLAAIANKQVDVTRRLIELGADVHTQHRLFGSPLHGAVSTGSTDLVRLVLDAGADVNERNMQGQTPLEALAAMHVMVGQLDSLHALGGEMFKQIEAKLNQLTDPAGWAECEKLLRSRGGK